MRVWIVHPKLTVYGGAELVVVKLANYMTKEGIENALLTTSILPEIERDLKGTRIIVQETKSSIIDKKSVIPIGEIIALHKGIKNNLNDFDIINVHNYPAELSVFHCNKPIVWMCNEPMLYLILEELKSSHSNSHSKAISKMFSNIYLNFTLRTLLEFEKFVVKNYVRYACVSDEFNAKRFKKIYGFKPEVINYGIDYEFFSKGDKNKILKKFGLYENFIVLQVGWIQPFKNQMESIKTIEKLKDKIPNIKLILAGYEEKGYKMILERYIKERGLEKNVIFTGHLDRELLRDVYHACDVLLHPVKSQGGWLAPFEALCAKRPIVVSTEMTASEIIKREKIGIVTNNFSETVLDIYKNPEKYNEMAERGNMWVRKNLSWEKFCEKMIRIFYKAMEERI
jgi:glycosyltransferase involved in cell wall biosynthesis